nr:PREDICTED: latent-transforming growth factor beta-binding protein 2 isoform X1 [Lepisosteus oculatus]
MDRLGTLILRVLTVVLLVRMCDTQRDLTGGKQDSANTRTLWDQGLARPRSQGDSAEVTKDGYSARPPSVTSYRTHQNSSPIGRGTQPRLPQSRNAPSTQGNRHTTVVGSSIPVALQEKDAVTHHGNATLTRDNTRVSTKQRVTYPSQHRARINSRQSSVTNGDSKHRAAGSRRLLGPNVCGGHCCSGWAIAPGTNRCIKPDCQPPCQNRGSCSRPHTCVCRSGFQGPRCEEVAPEQVYVRTGSSRALRPLPPSSTLLNHRRPEDSQGRNTSRGQLPRQLPESEGQPLSATQIRPGHAESSSHQTGTSRTVKRYPSPNGQITSNALPNGNGQLHVSQQPASTPQSFNSAVDPKGANLTANIDRIKIVFTPMICKRVCRSGQCFNSCEKGDTTTIYSENTQSQVSKSGFRMYFCQIPCMSGGHCIGRDQCWCPSNSTGKFCHLPAPPPGKHSTARKESGHSGRNSSHTMYTLPLSNQLASMHPSLVNVHIQHPPEAEVQIHQVARVKPDQVSPGSEQNSINGWQSVRSVQQRSQAGDGHGSSRQHGSTSGNGDVHSRLHNRLNGHVGRCFQETIDGQCGKPLPGLTKQDDCCGSVGASWGLNKCTACPPKPAYAVIANGKVECPKGYKKMNQTHCQDINECLMSGICRNAMCLNTRGSYRCTCAPGYMLDTSRSHCISDKAVSVTPGMCYRSVSGGTCSLPLSQHITKQICCCSRVGRAWGQGCERCPLPDTDHFKEICPAGHGYTYSLSDIQISLRQAEEEELAQTSHTQHEHHRTSDAQQTVRVPTDVGTVRTLPAVTEAPPKFPVDVVVKATPHSPVNLIPEVLETAPINVATQVTDIDRCSATPNVCGPGVCVPVQGGYTCYCSNGFHLNTLQTRCVDIDECKRDPCEGKGHCVNSVGSYTCYCYTGYSQVITQNRRSCQDVNECDMPNKCPGSVCINTEGSFTCKCENGYTMSRRGQCEDIDECRNPSTCPSGRCINTPGSFQCLSCDAGYRAQSGRCIDVNECLVPGTCANGRCVNSEGSYRCSCSPGYQATPDSGSCQDVDECLLPGVCSHGNCVNLEGSYRCSCNLGYQESPDSKSCEDINECATRNVCPSGICTNSEGSYSCTSCRPGYRKSADGQTCEDINECALASVCPGGVCTNTLGSYTCLQCRKGYRLSLEKQRCEDINECASPSICLIGICTNTNGSYFCTTCPIGYRPAADRQSCEDIDECASFNACPAGICTNTEGSFSCTSCGPGYRISEDGHQCEDIDECAVPGVCFNGVCNNNPGSYSCITCGTGYRPSADASTCEDEDECLLPGVCSHGNCVNLEGSHRCSCNLGYQESPDSKSCEDIDECAVPGVCFNGVCNNNPGSYSCITCGTGYRPSADASTCEDVDECSLANVCPGRLCKNTQGSFYCRSCEEGYELSEDGYGCEDVDECLSPGACPTGVCSNTEGSYTCTTCDGGYKLSADKGSCEDQNECDDADSCVGGDCINTPGSYSCSCPHGYELIDGSTCRDVNECLSPDICGLSGECLNAEGSFFCLCSPGYTIVGDGMGCQDVDECSEGTMCSRGQCLNTDGSFQCVCETGYKFSHEAGDCEDMDECKEYGTGICGTWRCENTLGSYRCFMGCASGVYGEDARDCDIDECTNKTICGKHGICENMDGSYRCLCDQGYTSPPGNPECVDINECEMSTALCGTAFCENVEGTFLCLCPNENEEFNPLTSQCHNPLLTGQGRGGISRDYVLSADEKERKECYYNLEDDNFCDNVLSRNTTMQECCCTVGAGWGDNCEIYPCPPAGRVEYDELCPHGKGVLSVDSPSLGLAQQLFKDADECEMFGSEICTDGSCVNIYSGYSCYCRMGYYYDTIRLACLDHNECEVEDTCVDGTCVNTPGSFNCFCSPPLLLDSTRRRCIAANFTDEDHLNPDERIHMEICWQRLTENSMCSNPLLNKRTTYTECCCLYGVAWGDQCAFCPSRLSAHYATLCNKPQRGLEGADGHRERPGYEYGPDSPVYGPGYGDIAGGQYYHNLGPEYGPQDPHTGIIFPGQDPTDDYGSRERARVPVLRPREFAPRLVDPYRDRYDGFEGLRAEECGILNGCENGRCVRVREGYTCDCFDGFELDLAKMACIDINECEDISDKVPLCQNGACVNTEGSYKCTCLSGFVASSQPHQCIPEAPETEQEAGQ